jgi:hypothetical protein
MAAWELSGREFDSVLLLPARQRYEYFVKRAASHATLLALESTGLVTAHREGRRTTYALA